MVLSETSLKTLPKLSSQASDIACLFPVLFFRCTREADLREI